MMKRNVILLSALFLLIIANVLMMSYSSPAFKPTSEGFAGYVQKFKGSVEKFTNYGATAGGAKDSYQSMGQYDGLVLKTGNTSSWRGTSPNEPLNGPAVEVGPDNLFLFKNNQCKPSCCGASFSCSGGCVCTTPEQRELINTRGGNRTRPESGV
jgi:hypothetical protein